MKITIFLFGMAIGGLITIVLLKTTLFYAKTMLEKAAKDYGAAVETLKTAQRINENSLEIKRG